MLKLHLTACTLATALLATTAMAQTNPAPSAQAPAAAPSTVAPSTSGTMKTTSAPGSTQFYTVMSGHQWRASKFVGVDIHGANNEKIGDVNDIIIDDQGNINAVVIGVGGFLGIGEKDVAIPFKTVEWMMTDRNARSAANNGAMGTNNPPNAANNGAMGTNNMAAGNSAAGTNRPANSTDVTGTTVASSDNKAYPDHGVLRMTKQDLQNAPSFHYTDAANARNTGGTQNPVPSGTKP